MDQKSCIATTATTKDSHSHTHTLSQTHRYIFIYTGTLECIHTGEYICICCAHSYSDAAKQGIRVHSVCEWVCVLSVCVCVCKFNIAHVPKADIWRTVEWTGGHRCGHVSESRECARLQHSRGQQHRNTCLAGSVFISIYRKLTNWYMYVFTSHVSVFTIIIQLLQKTKISICKLEV